MEFSKKQIEELMDQYLQDNEDFGDIDETKLINEVFKGFKNLLLENTSNKVTTSLLQEHANGLEGIPKDIFEDFVLYLQMTDLDSRLL
jgi:hypothetical protein